MEDIQKRGAPQYFHLLWDDEIERLRVLLEVLRPRKEDVLSYWYQLYVVHFGERRTLSLSEFKDIYGTDLDNILRNILRGDIDRFVADERVLGERLAERGVPFREVVASIHLFEESCSQVFRQKMKVLLQGPGVFLTFDKLSHCRLMVLAETYFGTTQARVTARIRGLEQEAARLSPDIRERRHFHGIVGQSPAMREVYQRIVAAASSRGTVFIIGESGTGKELVARAIHELGSPSSAPFVPVNCSALPRELIESELFGYKRGAFSGAVAEYMGLFRAAEGGSLFLDEVTEMAAETQAKLLRVLQERTIRPVGAVREIPVTVRIIASTNRDPREAVQASALRDDLYYRLNVNTITVPPLRDRMEDLTFLIDHFLNFFHEKIGSTKWNMEESALQALQRYHWPGNVRELMNVIESACTFGRSDMITLADLPTAIVGEGRTFVVERPFSGSAVPTFADAEKDLIEKALTATGGNKLRAARLLGVSRKKLYAKIAKYGLHNLFESPDKNVKEGQIK